MRVVQAGDSQELKEIMQEVRVDRYGIEIMLPKAMNYLLKMDSVSNITANILKQEMLSLGGDAAVARDSLTGRRKKTECLLIGSLSQLNRLNQKLKLQPFGLKDIASQLSSVLNNYQRDNFIIDLGRFKLNLKKGRYLIMGIMNLTPDSFSGDGFLKSNIKCQASGLMDFAQRAVRDGADIIDIGGESSRPGAKAVSLKEELKRTAPAIKILAKKIKVPLSIDTHKPEVARCALDNGALIVNDITGLRDLRMAKVIAKYKAGVVIMHMKGNPRMMQKNPEYGSLIDEIIIYLQGAIRRAVEAGIDREKIIIDPGIGFGKTAGHNLEILKKLKDFKVLGRPILVGPSRKSFIGKILNLGPQERVFGTVSACVSAVDNGAKIVRVHDVKQVKQGLRISENINRGEYVRH